MNCPLVSLMVVPQEPLGKGLTETIIPPILADTHFMGMAIESTVSPRDRILGALDKLPPFSPVLTRLLATLADEDVSFGELAAIIETDAVLAGNLLRVVNSPLYGRISTINSVRHAVAILGSVKIRNLVLGLSVSRRWSG